MISVFVSSEATDPIVTKIKYNGLIEDDKYQRKTQQKLKKFLDDNYSHAILVEKRFDWCRDKNPLPFDFYIPDLGLLIELDGSQHFKQVSNWQSPEEIQKHDVYKMIQANKHGYSMIRIFQEDVWNNKNNWQENLKKYIVKYEQPTIIFIGEVYTEIDNFRRFMNDNLDYVAEGKLKINDCDTKNKCSVAFETYVDQVNKYLDGLDATKSTSEELYSDNNIFDIIMKYDCENKVEIFSLLEFGSRYYTYQILRYFENQFSKIGDHYLVWHFGKWLEMKYYDIIFIFDQKWREYLKSFNICENNEVLKKTIEHFLDSWKFPDNIDYVKKIFNCLEIKKIYIHGKSIIELFKIPDPLEIITSKTLSQMDITKITLLDYKKCYRFLDHKNLVENFLTDVDKNYKIASDEDNRNDYLYYIFTSESEDANNFIMFELNRIKSSYSIYHMFRILHSHVIKHKDRYLILDGNQREVSKDVAFKYAINKWISYLTRIENTSTCDNARKFYIRCKILWSDGYIFCNHVLSIVFEIAEMRMSFLTEKGVTSNIDHSTIITNFLQIPFKKIKLYLYDSTNSDIIYNAYLKHCEEIDVIPTNRDHFCLLCEQ